MFGGFFLSLIFVIFRIVHYKENGRKVWKVNQIGCAIKMSVIINYISILAIDSKMQMLLWVNFMKSVILSYDRVLFDGIRGRKKYLIGLIKIQN